MNEISDLSISRAIESLLTDGGAEHAYSKPIPGWEVRNFSNFYGVHLAIWQIRPEDIQVKYPLNTSEQRAEFLAWCVVHGQLEYKALREVSSFWNELLAPANLENTTWSKGLSRLVQLAIRGRPDLNIDPCLATASCQKQALAWMYIQGGWKELGDVGKCVPAWQRAFFIKGENLAKSKFSTLTYSFRKDLQEAFDISTCEGTARFDHWLNTHGMHETFLSFLIKPMRRAWPPAEKGPCKHKFGVNLIGYAYGELGIGEDVRMAAHSLSAAGVPFTVINVNPGSNIRQNDLSISKWVTDEPEYIFNIVCLTALEHLRIYLEQGCALFTGRYNIGYWPWELHHWPKRWKHCFNLVDEVWASSKHIQRAVLEASDLIARHMPMAVPKQLSDFSKEILRDRYQLPMQGALFIFSFDGNSHTKRKNPAGVLEAFNLAFSDSDSAYLIIKCMRPNPENPDWKEILEKSKRSDRIIIIDKILDKPEVMNLYQSCDCYVSLHRAEGFGRGIAEAHYLGMHVISTNYGGNVDFCQALDADLVDYELIAVNPGEYVEADENFWAEPHIAHAAEAMQRVYKRIQSQNKKNLSHSNFNLLDKVFSPASIGNRYRGYLKGIYEVISNQ